MKAIVRCANIHSRTCVQDGSNITSPRMVCLSFQAIRKQLIEVCERVGVSMYSCSPDTEPIIKAIVAGMFLNLARKLPTPDGASCLHKHTHTEERCNLHMTCLFAWLLLATLSQLVPVLATRLSSVVNWSTSTLRLSCLGATRSPIALCSTSSSSPPAPTCVPSQPPTFRGFQSSLHSGSGKLAGRQQGSKLVARPRRDSDNCKSTLAKI